MLGVAFGPDAGQPAASSPGTAAPESKRPPALAITCPMPLMTLAFLYGSSMDYEEFISAESGKTAPLALAEARAAGNPTYDPSNNEVSRL